jgi:enoyl-CoA hydratase/carnithine racemase
VNSEQILFERKGRVAIVTINRPERMNAFNESLFESLGIIADELKSKIPRAVVITGAGKTSFCAGFDVNPDNPMVERIINAMSSENNEPARQLIYSIRKVIDSFISVPVPIIAALNGNAYGGGAELAARCDLRVMDPEAVICFSEVSLGLMPDWGGGAALARLVGTSRAADLILTARKIGSSEAYAMGLVNRISEKSRALDEAIVFAEIIVENGPRAVRNALSLIRENQNISFSASLQMEAELAATLISSGECFHGVSAFLEKKKPEFPDIE